MSTTALFPSRPGDDEALRQALARRETLGRARRKLLDTNKPSSDLELESLAEKVGTIDAAIRGCDERIEELYSSAPGSRR